MRRILLLAPLLFWFALLWTNRADVNAAGGCPSPAPTCSTSGTLSDFCGVQGLLIFQYACTVVGSYSDGSVHVSLLVLGSTNCNGDISTYEQTSNFNASSGSTFSGWANVGTQTGSYCLNDDDTGYLFPPSGQGLCPMAIVVDSAYNPSGQPELRLMDTTENRAQVGVCQAQF